MEKFRPARIPGLCAVALLLATASACGGDSDAAKPFREPRLNAVPVVTADLRLPLDDYELPVADRVRLQSGQARLVERCMAERGFRVKVYGDYLRPPGVVPLGGPVGTMTAEHAARLGYQAGPRDPFKLGSGMYLRSIDNLTLDPQLDPEVRNDSAFKEALDGPLDTAGQVPEGVEVPTAEPTGEPTYDEGCFERVEKDLRAPVRDTLDVAGDVLDLAAEHPEVASRMSSWVACMAEHGHRFQTVVDPFREYAFNEPSPDQVRVAVDDVACTASSHWADYFYAALADYQEQAIERDPQMFEAQLAAEQRRLTAVDRELGEG